MALGWDTEIVLLAAGLIFVWALLLGVWKYRQMSAAADGLAHPYVDTAHRAALMYSFATLLLAPFAELSSWSPGVDMAAAGLVIAYFAMAIIGYMIRGARRDTDNQFRDDVVPGLDVFMWTLIVAEIGGVLVLLAGFADARFF